MEKATMHTTHAYYTQHMYCKVGGEYDGDPGVKKPTRCIEKSIIKLIEAHILSQNNNKKEQKNQQTGITLLQNKIKQISGDMVVFSFVCVFLFCLV